ncbi:hypothetical protein [Candidatus Odyssella thessalonicensis]|uniref:hypothetical protein n=1 Tax=Candidatus Odyssella thessalonicensis TaxID=84647 RepID=UPI000225A943|nr:hypothetical protein [Candidatus Odyssella thessalonicensis]
MKKLAYLTIAIILQKFTIESSFASDWAVTTGTVPAKQEGEELLPPSRQELTMTVQRFEDLEKGLQRLSEDVASLKAIASKDQRKAYNFLLKDMLNLTIAGGFLVTSYALLTFDGYYKFDKNSPYIHEVKAIRQEKAAFIKEQLTWNDKLNRFPSSLAVPSAAIGLYYLSNISAVNHFCIKPTQRAFNWLRHGISHTCDRTSMWWYQSFSDQHSKDKTD